MGHLLGVLARGVEEEAGADGLADAIEVGARRHQVQLVPVHDLQQLLPHILRTQFRCHSCITHSSISCMTENDIGHGQPICKLETGTGNQCIEECAVTMRRPPNSHAGKLNSRLPYNMQA